MDFNNLEEENKQLRQEIASYKNKDKKKWSKRARLTKKVSTKFLGQNLKD